MQIGCSDSIAVPTGSCQVVVPVKLMHGQLSSPVSPSTSQLSAMRSIGLEPPSSFALQLTNLSGSELDAGRNAHDSSTAPRSESEHPARSAAIQIKRTTEFYPRSSYHRAVRSALVVAAVAGCGRIAFDEQRSAPDASPELDASVLGLDQGLVAHYPMDDDGVFLIDTSGGHHDGTCSVTSCAFPDSGVIGNAYTFLGAGTYLVPDAAELHLAAFTGAVWVQGTTGMAGFFTAFAKVQAAGVGASWELALFADHTEFCTDHDAGQLGEACLSTTVAIADGSWHHAALAFDGATETLYLDGVPVASVAAPATVYDGSPLSVGGDDEDGTPGKFFTGALDDLRIYDRALSASDVGALFALR